MEHILDGGSSLLLAQKKCTESKVNYLCCINSLASNYVINLEKEGCGGEGAKITTSTVLIVCPVRCYRY